VRREVAGIGRAGFTGKGREGSVGRKEEVTSEG